jgi:hypothetical protein
MTDSIRINLPLDKLDVNSLKRLPLGILETKDHFDPKVTTGIQPRRQYPQSPLTEHRYELKVITTADTTPVAIKVSVNVPTLLVGQNTEHGLSVAAATVASFLLVKHFLASYGVPRTELDKLELADVRIEQATLTYLLETTNARKDLELLSNALCVLHPEKKHTKRKYAEGTRGVFDADGNITIYCNRRPFALTCYAKSDDVLAKFPAHSEFGQSHIRVELVLHGAELRQRGWDHHAAWCDAHESLLYQQIFDEYVQNQFLRLDEKLRQVKPDDSDIAKLTGLSLKVFKGYATGKDSRTKREFKELAMQDKRKEQKLFSEVKRDIYQTLRMDITIPFKKHIQLNTSKLRELVVWSGDHNPEDEVAELCFCKANWPALKQALVRAVDDTCKNYVAQTGSNASFKADPDTGEILSELPAGLGSHNGLPPVSRTVKCF